METIVSNTLQSGAILLALGIFVWAAFVVHRHYSKRTYPARMARMMRQIGIETKDVEALQYETHLPTAARLCDGCTSKDQCDGWLAAQLGRPAPAFCPNAQFFQLVANQNVNAS